MEDVTLSATSPEIASVVSGAGSQLGAYLTDLVRDLIELTPKALDQNDAEAVHQTRVATRRLTAALELVGPIVSRDPSKAFVRTLKKLRRSLGDLRDLDVMEGHLKDIWKRHRSLKPAVKWLQMQLAVQRASAGKRGGRRASMSEKFALKLARWQALRAEVDARADTVDMLLGQSLHRQLHAFSAQSGAIVAELASPPAGARRHDPHELRIAGKALRYTLEMAREQGHDLPGKVFKTFKALQEHLGLWHDFVVLADWCVGTLLGKQLSHFDPAGSARVLDIAKICVKRCAEELHAFGELWTTEGEQLARSICEVFPIVAQTIRSPSTDAAGEVMLAKPQAAEMDRALNNDL